MFAMIDLAYIGVTAFVCLRYYSDILGAWQHLVAWTHGAESYAAYLDGKAKTFFAKAEAVKAAATTAATAVKTAVQS